MPAILPIPMRSPRIILALLLTLTLTEKTFAQTFPSESRLAAAQPANPADLWSKSFDRDDAGFTIFPLGQGARIVLLSSTDGSDFYDGMLKPVRTLKKALSLARNGYPDRILFKRGDTFEAAALNSNLEIAGRDITAPIIIGAYGDNRLPRPIILGHLYLGPHVYPRFVAIQSLDFYASTRDPTQKGFDARPGNYLWIEDCRFRDHSTSIDLESKESRMYDTVVIRRCQILDSWDRGHSSGIYIDFFRNVLIEENLFDHNGWTEFVPDAGKTIFNHNM